MGDLKNWQKLALWAADRFPKNKLSQDLAYKIISDPQVGYQAGATTKDVTRNVFSSKPKEEDTNKYMFVYGADTRRPETTIGQAYDWSEDIRENGYENVKTYSGVLNPYNEYLVDSRNKGLVEEFAKVGYSPVSNINNEYIDWNTYRLKQGTPYFDDVHGYRPTFHFNNGKPVISSSDLYDFGKNYIGDFTDLYVERSGNEKDPAFTMELQRRALNSVGQPYLLVQKNIPIRFVDNPQGNEIWRTNNFNKELRLDEMSDREISDILHTGYIEPSKVTAHKKGGRIHIKKKNRGKFTEYCGGKVTEECIAKGKKSKDPKIRKRATFAANARKWKHENGGILKAQEGTGNGFWSKLWNAVKAGGMAARDAKFGAVGAQQVRDLYSEGKNQEAQDLAKQYAKANTTGIALAGGAASTGLLGDLIVTGATTAADTFIDGDVDNFGKNLSLNAAFDLIGHGAGKLLRKIYPKISQEATSKIEALLKRFPEGVKSTDSVSKELKDRLIKEGVDPSILTQDNLKKMVYLRSKDLLESNVPDKFAARTNSKISNTYNLYYNTDGQTRNVGYVVATPENGVGKIKMIENVTEHTPNKVKGVSELGYNTVIKDIGASKNGTVLMQPNKTKSVLDKYPDKVIIANDGEWFNGSKYIGGNPIFQLNSPTYDVPIKYLDDFSVEGVDDSGKFLFDFTKDAFHKKGGKL